MQRRAAGLPTACASWSCVKQRPYDRFEDLKLLQVARVEGAGREWWEMRTAVGKRCRRGFSFYSKYSESHVEV